MSDSQSQHIVCPSCNANNFPSSTQCWQCGRPLLAGSTPEGPQPPGPTPPIGGPLPNAYPQPPRPNANTQTLIILGVVFAVLALLPGCCGWPFGIAAIVLGAIATSRGDSRGTWVIIAGAAGLIVGFVISHFIGQYALKNLPNWQRQHGGSFPVPPQR